MSQTLIRILYLSSARPDIAEPDVEAIVSHAVRANEIRDVTGALAFNGRTFCQCLEGEKYAIADLLALIKQDERHTDLRIMGELEVEKRYFSSWRMRWVFDHSFMELREAMIPQPLPKFS